MSQQTQKLTTTQIQYRLASNLTKRSSRLALKQLGCSLTELQHHLEAQFKEGMSWESYGTHGWQIDHIVPLQSTKDHQARLKLHHYTNLQPLWAKHNQQKGAQLNWVKGEAEQGVGNAEALETLRLQIGEGEPFSAAQARNHGCSSALLSYHEKRGNLLRLGRGAFMFPAEDLDPCYAAAFLSNTMPDLHIGAETAISWHAMRDLSLFWKGMVVVTQNRKRLPHWSIEKLLITCVRRTAFRTGDKCYVTNIESGIPELKGAKVSSQEMALIETLNDVGSRLSIECAQAAVHQIRKLDVDSLVELLEASGRVKVQRLCLRFAEGLRTRWAQELTSKWKPNFAAKRWSGSFANGMKLEFGPNATVH